jgi:hypothetical protein
VIFVGVDWAEAHHNVFIEVDQASRVTGKWQLPSSSTSRISGTRAGV